MNSNTQKLVSVFNQDELAGVMTALAGYINTKRKQGRSTAIETVAFNKIVDALLVSNYMNAEEIEVKPNANAPMGSAAYKAYEAMYDSDVEAHRW
jgi:hypothetical protein